MKINAHHIQYNLKKHKLPCRYIMHKLENEYNKHSQAKYDKKGSYLMFNDYPCKDTDIVF